MSVCVWVFMCVCVCGAGGSLALTSLSFVPPLRFCAAQRVRPYATGTDNALAWCGEGEKGTNGLPSLLCVACWRRLGVRGRRVVLAHAHQVPSVGRQPRVGKPVLPVGPRTFGRQADGVAAARRREEDALRLEVGVDDALGREL